MSDLDFMQRALELARFARGQGEVPVGAVVVLENKIIGEGYNQPIARHDPTAHAEIIALREAAHYSQNYRLPKAATLYVTLEPCAMCVGALQHARVGRLVFGASDPKTGAVDSVYKLLNQPVSHKIAWEKGLLAEESAALLRHFFQERR